MNIEKIYIQKSFQTHPVENPFLYSHIGIGIALNPGESLEEAEKTAQEYLNNYINKNTQYPEHGHIEERALPEVQKGNPITMDYDVVVEEINKCTNIKELDEWSLIAKTNLQAGIAFAKKAAQILSKQ